ncbi:MAG: hypothetical protein R3C99_13550 [Pirellulaceae bacterium]
MRACLTLSSVLKLSAASVVRPRPWRALVDRLSHGRDFCNCSTAIVTLRACLLAIAVAMTRELSAARCAAGCLFRGTTPATSAARQLLLEFFNARFFMASVY